MELGSDAAENPSGSLAADIARRCGQHPSSCYQCGKCTAGCPLAFAMEIDPARLMRLVQLGRRDAVLNSRTIWLCASCETCTARCPQEVDLARVMDALRILARDRGYAPAEREVASLNQTLLAGVKARGRVHETALAVWQNVRTGHPFRDVAKGPLLMRKGKMMLRGHKVANADQVRRLFENVARVEGSEE